MANNNPSLLGELEIVIRKKRPRALEKVWSVTKNYIQITKFRGGGVYNDLKISDIRR